MSIKCASLSYVSPPTHGYPQAFIDNLRRFKPKHDLILYSDHDWGKDFIKLRFSPELWKEDVFLEGPHRGEKNTFAMHNGLFLVALKMARERGVTHMLYLEQDCRVGVEGWDDVIFDEYFSLGRPCIVAGTLSVYNPANYGVEGLKRFCKLAANPPRHGIPTPAYGWFGAATQGPSCIFPNGALAVYDLAWLLSMFDVENQRAMASQNTAFDMAVGSKLFDLFSEDAYEVTGSLSSVYSGFGDVLTTPSMRRELLTSGKVVAMHQEKTEWAP